MSHCSMRTEWKVALRKMEMNTTRVAWKRRSEYRREQKTVRNKSCNVTWKCLLDDVIPKVRHLIKTSRYFVTLLGSYNGYSLAQLTTRKNEAKDAVAEMILEIDNLLNQTLPRLRSINCSTLKWIETEGGEEYHVNESQRWVHKRGVVHKATAAYSPKFNGAALRFNWTLLHMVGSMLLMMRV